MLTTSTTHSGVKVLSASVGRMRDLTITYHNLARKLREALTIGSEWMDTHAGSEPFSTIKLAIYLIKLALWSASLIRVKSLIYLTLWENWPVDLWAGKSSPNNIWRIVVSKILTCWPYTLVCISLGWVRGFFPLRRVLWIVATYDAHNFLTMVEEYLLSDLVIH